MNDLLSVLTEGHRHAPGEPCSAYLEEGRYGFGEIEKADRVKGWSLCLDYCPCDTADPESYRLLELAEQVCVDPRALDIEASSASEVELVWSMAAWLRRRLH